MDEGLKALLGWEAFVDGKGVCIREATGGDSEKPCTAIEDDYNNLYA